MVRLSGAPTQPAPPRTETYGPHPDQFVEVWSTTAPRRGTAVLIHGGYWRHRYGLDLMHSMAAHLASQGWLTVNIEYRRIEDRHGVWNEMAADVRSAVELAASIGDRVDSDSGDNSGDGEGRAGPVVVIGHSAGGHLALWSAVATDVVDATVALAPVADLAEADRRSLSNGAVRELLGGDRAAQPERYRAASPAARLPLGVPQLVVHGHIDDNVPFDMSEAYVDGARAAGDDVTMLAPPDVDHFHVIDPAHPVWSDIDAKLVEWANYDLSGE